MELSSVSSLRTHKIFFPAKVGGALGNDLPNAWQLCDSCPWANLLLCDLSILKTVLFCGCYSQKDCTDIPFHRSSHFIMKTQGFHVSKDFLSLRHGFYSVHQFVFWHCTWYSLCMQKISLHSPLCKRFKCFCCCCSGFHAGNCFSFQRHHTKIQLIYLSQKTLYFLWAIIEAIKFKTKSCEGLGKLTWQQGWLL